MGIALQKFMQIVKTRTWSVVPYTKSYAKFKLNMSKHVEEKSGKLCIPSILCSKRGITPTHIDAK